MVKDWRFNSTGGVQHPTPDGDAVSTTFVVPILVFARSVASSSLKNSSYVVDGAWLVLPLFLGVFGVVRVVNMGTSLPPQGQPETRSKYRDYVMVDLYVLHFSTSIELLKRPKLQEHSSSAKAIIHREPYN